MLSPPRLNRPLTWLTPFVTTALVYAIQLAILPRPSLAPFVLFFAGVGFAAWLAGVWAGLVAVVLSAIVVDFAFLEPYSWFHSMAELRAIAGFVLSASSVAWFAGSLRGAVDRAEDASTKLSEASRRKDEFIAMLSHELRNPLAPIRNSLFILRKAPRGSTQEARAKEIIERQVEHLTRLVDDLLDVARISRGTILLKSDEVELSALVRQAVEDHRSTFELDGLQVDLVNDERLIWVHGDAARLSQVVSHLLTNAAKFTAEGGRAMVSVELAPTEREAIVRVSDTGPGIAPDVLDHLFQPFTQADRSLARSSGGLGLGLSLAKGIIDLHGGSISARNRNPERGAEIEVRLPIVRLSIPAARARSEHPSASRPRLILIIEDNADAADSLRDVLQLGGNQVEVAYNGPEGIEKARSFKPDIVLCDIGLPGMDGYEVAKALRADESLRGARLIALTGYAQPEDRKQAAEAGFAQHLAKPLSPEALERALEDAPRS